MSPSTDNPRWHHTHRYIDVHAKGESRTRWVILLTAVTMVAEIAGGTLWGSMALLADGWHMGTHVMALTITVVAYRYARRHADDPAFAFGTGKVGVLGGFASAVVLAMVALLMGIESLERLMHPKEIRFDEAMLVAVIGLIVNLLSAWLLHGHHDHHHDHAHGDAHQGHTHDHDHNLRAAYLHVIADALTSILAIASLTAGKYMGWYQLDAWMGVVGGLVILRWSWGLLQDTGRILLDRHDDQDLYRQIEEIALSVPGTAIADQHIWPLAPHRYALLLSLTSEKELVPQLLKNRLENLPEIVHVTVEVNPLCRNHLDEAEPRGACRYCDPIH